MATANKIDSLLERAFTEGSRLLNDDYSELLKVKTGWGEICRVFQVNTERADLSLMLDVPEYVQEIGGVAFSDLKAGNLVVTPERFSAGIKEHEDNISDDRLGIIIDRIRDLGESPAIAFNKHVFLALKYGVNTTTYGACYDSGALFSTHTNDAGSFDNYDTSVGGATAWFLLDCSGRSRSINLAVRSQPVLKQEPSDSTHRFETGEIRWKIQGRMWPFYGLWQKAFASTNALTDDMLWTGIQTMRGFQDNSGQYLSVGPTHLCVAPDTEQTARELLERTRLMDATGGTADYITASNEPVQNLRLKLIVSPHLT